MSQSTNGVSPKIPRNRPHKTAKRLAAKAVAKAVRLSKSPRR